MNPGVVNKPVLFAFTSVAMLAGFVVIALLAIPLRGTDQEMSLAGSLFLLPIPAAFAGVAFWFMAANAPGGRLAGALVVAVGGVGSTFVFSAFGPLLLVLAPLATAGIAVLCTRMLRAA